MQVKTIINLRHRTRKMDAERQLAEQLGMRWVNIPMRFWWRPSDAQVRQFLSIVRDPTSRPVFVHCRQGRNRVGILTAVYRVVEQGWSPQEAYWEGRQLGMVPWNPLTRYLLFHETAREFLSTEDVP